MKLQSRVTLAAATVIAIVGISVGLATVFNNYFQAIGRVDKRLNANAAVLTKASQSALSTSLLLGSQTDIAVTVAYISRAGELTELVESPYVLTKSPGTAFLKNSLKQSVAGPSATPARWRSVSIGDGEYVIFASDISQIVKQRNDQLRWLFFLLLTAVALGIFAINRLIRRDIRQIENLAKQSTLIAGGDTTVQLPTGDGNSEVDQLSNSLSIMVANLLASIEREKRIQHSMQDFLADASHELRTPLTSIRGYTEILAGSVAAPTEQQARALDRISSEIARMDTLISDLLLLAELGESKPMTTEIVDLTELVSEQVADLKQFQPERVVEYSSLPEVKIHGSTELIIRLLNNIFSNLRRHTTESDEVRVCLSTDGQNVVLDVSDAGPGLAEKFYELQELNPFMRFDSSRARATGGSGLGMSIIKAIVDNHGGELVLRRSELGGHRTTVILRSAG